MSELRLMSTSLKIKNINIKDSKINEKAIIIKTASPIVTKKNDMSKTLYFSPMEDEFYRLITKNACEKFKSFYGYDYTHSLELISLKEPKKVVTMYKKFYITAWAGEFSLKADNDMINLLYNSGIGSKNSQGFGMFEVKHNCKNHCV